MVSGLFSFEHPTCGEIKFHLRFVPKPIDHPNYAYLYMQITDAPFDFSISMDCQMWVESLDKQRYEAATDTPTFVAESTAKLWESYLTPQKASEFFRSPTIFVCLRLPYAVKSLGSVSKNSTLHRWNITDFELRSEAATFQTAWESDEFVVSEFKDVKFAVQFYPKGDREDFKDRCAVYLIVKDFAGYSKVPVQFEFWMENKESRLHKVALNHMFETAMGHGRPTYIALDDLRTFVQIIPFNVCCNVQPIIDSMAISKTVLDQEPTFALFFNNPLFSDVEICVDNEVFKVSRAIISGSSPVFRAMFDKETEEQKSGVVKIKGFEAAMVEKMLIYIYKYEVVNLHEVATELLPVADYYQVNTLVKKCTESLVGNLAINNVLSTLALAFERPHLENFQERVMKFAHENIKEICKLSALEDFVAKHPEVAIKLLKISNSIN
ncbi:hypothetical protein M3Y94_00652800 [Aphelenchoides besseyi]|nr:hypothetical protein M3Y94_00652800 [Aphelenchoides besseyi]